MTVQNWTAALSLLNKGYRLTRIFKDRDSVAYTVTRSRPQPAFLFALSGQTPLMRALGGTNAKT